MRAALLQNAIAQSRGSSRAVHLPAPVGGWNTRDAVAAMGPTDAVTLNNWFPSVGEVVMRGGSTVAATVGDATKTVYSLYQYAAVGGSAQLFAVTDAGIYNVSGGGAVPSVAQALTNGKWNAVQFTNSVGGHYLWGVNGTDKVTVFDGTTWSQLDGGTVIPILGVDGTTLIYPWLFKRKIWAVQTNSMDAWYFPTDSVGGNAIRFPVGPLFTRGGYLVAGTSWTVDGGDGADDFLVFATSEGEIAVYSGSDPDTFDGIRLVGVYYIGPPLGRRCFVKFGGDVIMLTEQGALPLSQSLQSASIDYTRAVSDKIQPSFAAAGGLYRGNFGWQATFFPLLNALVVNVPVVAGIQSQQFVMNTLTHAWCSFTGWNASSFTVFADDLYFGGAGGQVFKAWHIDQRTDAGADVVASAQTAFSSLDRAPDLKTVNSFRALLQFSGVYAVRWGLASDYDPAKYTGGRAAVNAGVQTLWGSAWGSPWATASARAKTWTSAQCKPGYAFSLALEVSSKSSRISWAGTDYLVERGAQA